MKHPFFNTFVNIVDEEQYDAVIRRCLSEDKKGRTFFYLNSHSFHALSKDENFRNVFNTADYVIPDGYSIALAMKLLYSVKINKVVFTYFFVHKFAKYLEEEGTRVFLLGTTENNLDKAIKMIKKRYPRLNIVGWQHGFFSEENSSYIISKINNTTPDILISGLGIPKSEIWIANNKDRINAKCIFSVGGFYEFIAGHLKLAPKWIYNSGFEWAFRLIQEPRRLWKRYLVVNSYFIFRIIKALFQNAFKRN